MLKVSAVLLCVFVVFKFGSRIIISYWHTKNPPKAAPPDMRFSKIPSLILEDIKQTKNLKFKLETPTNTLPPLEDRAKVYYSPFSKPNLLALEKARKQALLLGFTGEEKKVSEKVYQWYSSDGLTTLVMNIINGTFIKEYQWQQNQSLLTNKLAISEEEAINLAFRTLSQVSLAPDDISEETAKITYLKISGQKLTEAVSQSEANFIKVDFYRKDIDNLPVETISPHDGVIQVVLSGSITPENGIVKLSYQYFPIDYGTSSDYPLSTNATLWNQFIAGEGYIISEPSKRVNDIVIRRVYLGYLDTMQEQKFLQPVLFFQGDHDFLGFIPALNSAVYQ